MDFFHKQKEKKKPTGPKMLSSSADHDGVQ